MSEAERLICMPVITEVGMCRLVEVYIKDRKGIDVKINIPQDPLMMGLLFSAYNRAVKYYT